MELREYLAILRAYNLVRQRMDVEERLTFAEFAILCRMQVLNRTLNTSEIADYQGALRPTMTHRAKHLAELELIDRTKGTTDRRNVTCVITSKGVAYVKRVCGDCCEVLRAGNILMRTTPQRFCRYVNATGSIGCMSGDLVLLGILLSQEEGATISGLVALLGLLQPTVSMSAAALERQGIIMRQHAEGATSRFMRLFLTDEGIAQAQELASRIQALVMHRKV